MAEEEVEEVLLTRGSADETLQTSMKICFFDISAQTSSPQNCSIEDETMLLKSTFTEASSRPLFNDNLLKNLKSIQDGSNIFSAFYNDQSMVDTGCAKFPTARKRSSLIFRNKTKPKMLSAKCSAKLPHRLTIGHQTNTDNYLLKEEKKNERMIKLKNKNDKGVSKIRKKINKTCPVEDSPLLLNNVTSQIDSPVISLASHPRKSRKRKIPKRMQDRKIEKTLQLNDITWETKNIKEISVQHNDTCTLRRSLRLRQMLSAKVSKNTDKLVENERSKILGNSSDKSLAQADMKLKNTYKRRTARRHEVTEEKLCPVVDESSNISKTTKTKDINVKETKQKRVTSSKNKKNMDNKKLEMKAKFLNKTKTKLSETNISLNCSVVKKPESSKKVNTENVKRKRVDSRLDEGNEKMDLFASPLATPKKRNYSAKGKTRKNSISYDNTTDVKASEHHKKQLLINSRLRHEIPSLSLQNKDCSSGKLSTLAETALRKNSFSPIITRMSLRSSAKYKESLNLVMKSMSPKIAKKMKKDNRKKSSRMI